MKKNKQKKEAKQNKQKLQQTNKQQKPGKTHAQNNTNSRFPVLTLIHLSAFSQLPYRNLNFSRQTETLLFIINFAMLPIYWIFFFVPPIQNLHLKTRTLCPYSS